jgi:hypothetical protein
LLNPSSLRVKANIVSCNRADRILEVSSWREESQEGIIEEKEKKG